MSSLPSEQTAAAPPPLSSSTAATLYRLPTTTSCLDLLQQGQSATTTTSSKTDTGSPPQQQQQQPSLKHSLSHGSSSLAATAALNAANAATGSTSSNSNSPPVSVDASKTSAVSSGAVLSRLGSSSGWAHRAAEARAAAVSGIKSMPERPLALLYRLVDLMKVGKGGMIQCMVYPVV